MAKASKKTITIILIILVVGTVFILKTYVFNTTNQKERIILARSKGDPSAHIHILEFIDFQCPACAYGANVINGLMKKYPDQIYLQLRYYPLAMHVHAVTGSIYAECAAKQKKFWPFHDLILQKQNEWKRFKDVHPAFMDIAQQADLNIDQLKACISDPVIEERVYEDKDEGRARGVKSTPTYFVNDEMVVGGQGLITKLNQLLNTQ